MANKKALCILTTRLGHKTAVRELVKVLDRLPGFEPTYVLITPEDYMKFGVPWWIRATDPWHCESIARQKVSAVVQGSFDLFLVNAWELVVGFRDLAERIPAVAILDAVPATMDRQLRQTGTNSFGRRLASRVHHRAFRKAASKFQLFLPMGSDCSQSLQDDYAIERGRCDFLTLAPQDLASSIPEPRNYGSPTRLLFVGNDFARKGGEFLLSLYVERLAHTCTLTIVSNDPALRTRQFPKGVQWLPSLGLEQVRKTFRESHIFVFPTQQDFMPQVLGEALAFGLPCIANDVGGIRDLVRDGETGFLMPPSAPIGLWAERIQQLAKPEFAAAMSKRARRFAEQRLSLEGYENLIVDVIAKLRYTDQASC